MQICPKFIQPEVFRGILRIILGGKHFSDPMHHHSNRFPTGGKNGRDENLPGSKKALQEDIHQSKVNVFNPWEPTTFIFKGYDPYIEGLKPSFFMVLGSKGSLQWFGACFLLSVSPSRTC